MKKKHLVVIALYTFFSCFISAIPFYALYLKNVKGCTVSQILLFFSVYTLGGFIFEIPTGLIADKFGVKVSITCGHSIRLASVIILIVSSKYIGVLSSQFILALGDSLISGSSDTYFISFYKESEKCLSKKNYSYEKFIARLSALNWMGIASAFFLGSFCAFYNILSPFILTGFSYFLCFILSLQFAPVAYDKRKYSGSIRDAITTIRHSRKLLIWIPISVLISVSLSTMYLMIQPLMNDYGFSGFQNGIIYGLTTLCAVFGSYIEPVLFNKKININIMMSLLFVMLICCAFIFGHNHTFVIFIVIFCIFRFIYGTYSPLLSAKTNLLITTESSRTTVLNIISLYGSLIQTGMLQIIAIAGHNDITTKFTLLSLCMCIELIVFCIFTWTKHKNQ
jgi:MFS family permease